MAPEYIVYLKAFCGNLSNVFQPPSLPNVTDVDRAFRSLIAARGSA